MSTHTFTLTLDGKDISLDRFAQLLLGWQQTLVGLARQQSRAGEFSISVTDLFSGSANVVVTIETPDEESGLRLVHDFAEVHQAIQANNLVRFPRSVQDGANRMLKQVQSEQKQLVFLSADDTDFVLKAPSPGVSGANIPKATTEEAYGGLEGRIQTLSSRNSLRFVLYDRVHDKGVRGTFPPDLHDQIQDLWDKEAYVEGWISRDAQTGIPLSIRRVQEVVPLPEHEPGSYRRAGGVLKALLDLDESPEDIIRRARNA